jgi:heat shock protein 1/8
VQVEHEGKVQLFSPEEVSSVILDKMKRTAETFLGADVSAVCVFVCVMRHLL